MREFASGATRDTDEGKNDYRGFVSPQALKRFGDYMTEHRKQADGKIRDSDNWKKGMPQREYLSSLLRHTVDLHAKLDVRLQKWAFNTTPSSEDEKEVQDLLCAIWFNTQGLLHERVLGRDVGRVNATQPEPVKVPTFKEWLQAGWWEMATHAKMCGEPEFQQKCTYWERYETEVLGNRVLGGPR